MARGGWKSEFVRRTSKVQEPAAASVLHAPPSAKAALPSNQTLLRNRATSSEGGVSFARVLRKASANAAPAQASGEARTAPLGGKPLPAEISMPASRQMGTDLSGVHVHDDSYADKAARDMGADAFTLGEDVFLRRGTAPSSSPEGRHVLDHELAHVAQYRKGLLGQPDPVLERQADQMASKESAAPASGSGGSPRVLRKGGARCTAVTLTAPNHIVFYGTQGPISGTAELTTPVPPGTYDVQYSTVDNSLKLSPWPTGDLVFTVSGSIRGTDAQIAAYQKKFQDYLDSLISSPVKLTVQGNASGTLSDSGDNKGTGGAGAGKGAKNKSGGGNPADGGTTGTTPLKKAEPIKDGPAGAPGGKEGGKGTGGGTEGKAPGKGEPGGTSPVPQQGSHGPVVRIDDASQIDELKRRGVLDDKIADSIKDKSGKGQELSFEETIALLDALSQSMVTRTADAKKDDPQKPKQKESWVDVARLIKENRDKFSGQQATGDDGMSLAEMKAVLAKYHEFVGTKDAPKPKEPGAPGDRVEKFNPEKRKSWNSLDTWEKDIWKQYSTKYGEPGTDSSEDLKLTPQMKFRLALSMSPSFMKEGAREAADALFHDPIFIGGTILGIAIWVVAWLAPEPIFSKAFAASITLAMLTVFSVSEIKNVAVAWMRLQDEAEAARSFSEYEEAAEHFGKSMGGTGLRVLVMLATIVAGKALPSPKGPVGGGGGSSGMAPATAGGPSIGAIAAEATEIKVLADGTVVILGTRGGTIVQSVTSGGGGGSTAGGSKGGKSGGPATGSERVKPKEEAPPQDTQQIKAPSRWGPDVEQQQGVGKQVGNFAHKFYEKLKTFIPGNKTVVSEDIAPGLEPEHRIENPSYKDPRTAPRIDRLDRANGVVIEIGPDGLYEQKLAEAKAYALEMDKYEPLSGGRRWEAKCITYDFEAVLQYLEKIGYLTAEEAAGFRAKAKAPKGK